MKSGSSAECSHSARLVAVSVVVLIILIGLPPSAASAAISRVQLGSVATSSSSTVSPSLTTRSTTGNLLVATIAADTTNAVSAPAGWTRAAAVSTTAADPGRIEIWYYAGNPGSISSAIFTVSGATQVEGQLSEWSGVAVTSPLDATGTSAPSSRASSVTASTTGATVVSGEVAISAFDFSQQNGHSVTFTPGSGWTNLGGTGASGTAQAITNDDETNVAVGTVSELESSSRSGSWAAAVATFKPACRGGTLNLTPPSSVAFPSVTLTGVDRTAASSIGLTTDDETGSGAGWNVSGTSTTFTNAAQQSLPTTATVITGASSSAATGECSAPTNAVSYPVTLPAGSIAPAAAKLFDASAGTGSGPVAVTLNLQLSVPASSYTGTYSSTWTFTIASGP